MEIQEFQNLPYIKRQKIVKRLYEKKLMSRSALYKSINRGRKLKKEEQLLFDKYLVEVNKEELLTQKENETKSE
jgi:hypothetical protein